MSTIASGSTERRPIIPGTNYASLQALRALAAGLVVLFHINHSIFDTDKYWPDRPFGTLLEFGHSGVEFFFVLSGFIIFTAHRRDIGKPAKLTAFAWKRFRRIYPVYWVMLVVLLAAYAAFPTANLSVEAAVIADSVSLLHVFDDKTLLSVSWTLFHEVAFYGVFAVLILHRSLGSAVLAAWLACSALSALAPSLVPDGLAFYMSPLHLLFGMGMSAAWFLTRARVPAPWAVTAVAAALFMLTGLEDAWGHHIGETPLALLYGATSALVVAGAVELERSGRLRISRVFVFLGNASYSVYLVHFLTLSVLAKCLQLAAAHISIPHPAIFVFLAMAAISVGLAFHVVVEVPLMTLLGQVKFSPRRAAADLSPQAMANPQTLQ